MGESWAYEAARDLILDALCCCFSSGTITGTSGAELRLFLVNVARFAGTGGTGGIKSEKGTGVVSPPLLRLSRRCGECEWRGSVVESCRVNPGRCREKR